MSTEIAHSIILNTEDYYFNQILMECFVNGLYTAVFATTLSNLVITREKSTRKYVMIAVVIILYGLSILHVAIRWKFIRNSMILNNQTEQTVYVAFETPSTSIMALSGASFLGNAVLADCVLVWRCWTAWNKSKLIVFLPLLSLAAELALSIFSLYAEIQAYSSFVYEYEKPLPKWNRTGLVAFAISLFTTVYATTFIVYRIYLVGGTKGMKKYRAVVEVVLDSALLYSVVLLVYFIFLAIEVAYLGYAQALICPITGLAPTLIISRVAVGMPGSATESLGHMTTIQVGRFDGTSNNATGDLPTSSNANVEKDNPIISRM